MHLTYHDLDAHTGAVSLADSGEAGAPVGKIESRNGSTVVAPAKLIKDFEDRSGNHVCISVAHDIDRPRNEVVLDRPNLGEFFDTFTADPSFGHDARMHRAEYMHVELTEDECCSLRIGPWDSVGGNLWNVFFAGDWH